MENFNIIKGDLSPEEAKKRKEIITNFRRDFNSTLKERGVWDDFSLNKVVEEVANGKNEFGGHEKEIYDKIKDLFEMPPVADETAMPIPEEIKKAA